MNKIAYQTILLLSIITMLFSAGCAPKAAVKGDAANGPEPTVITDIRLQDNRLDIVSNKPFVYTMYKGADPYKLIIDIPDMGSGIFREKITSDKAGITEVIPQQTDSPSKTMKITVSLQGLAVVTPVYKDTTLTLTVKPEEAVAPVVETKDKDEVPVSVSEVKSGAPESAPEPKKQESGSDAASAKQVESSIAYIPHATEISSIELSRSSDAVKVLIQGNGSMMPNVFPIDERIVIDIPGVSLNAHVPTAVISPLKSIRAGKHKEKVRLVLDLKEKTKFEVTAIGKMIEVALKGARTASDSKPAAATVTARENAAPEVAKESSLKSAGRAPAIQKEAANGDSDARPAGKSEPRYSGKKISLDFQDADIGPIFRLLADVNGYNLVLDPTVKGKITIKLMNVPWDQALDIVLNTFHLGKSVDGNILWIAPITVFNKIAQEKSSAKETEEKTEELVQEILRINYATAAELSAAFNAGKLLSPRGSITQDLRMNTLIIKDTQKSIDKMKELVKIMDVTKPQVMIEAKIVEVSTGHSDTLGIRWGGSMSLRTGAYPVGGSFAINSPVSHPTNSMTVPGGAVGITVGAANSLKVDLSLSALESIGKSKTLSSPKILTMDNEAANIQQGTTFFIPVVQPNGAISSVSQTATLSLTVTPKITPDGYVQLKVTATDNSLEPGTAGASAIVNTKNLNTNALVKNGETLVLGGIYRRDESSSEDAVPMLGKVPGLGWLFKTRTRIGPSTKELMIFITPTIVRAEDKVL